MSDTEVQCGRAIFFSKTQSGVKPDSSSYRFFFTAAENQSSLREALLSRRAGAWLLPPE